MTENITVSMVTAARDLVQQVMATNEHPKAGLDEGAETTARLFRIIYRAIADSVYHSGNAGRK